MEIQLEGFRIRSWTRADEASLIRHANNRAVWINLRDRFPHPYRRSDARAWLGHVMSHRPETSFAIAIGEEAVGGIGYHIQEDVHRRSAEIGYWLGEPFWGRGIATRAVHAITAQAFATHDLTRVFACVFEWNPASARVLEKAGYTREATMRKSVFKDGKTIDQYLYAMVRDSWESNHAIEGA